MKTFSRLLAFAVAMASVGSALADPIVLKFEGINAPGVQSTPIGNFYNGGGGAANNFGIAFSSNALALCLNTPGDLCSNTSRGGLGDPTSQKGGLVFLSGSQTFLDDSAGFTTGFSLFYSAINQPGSLSVYSGLDGTGTLLASLNLPLTTSACGPQFSAGFCPFVPIGVSFTGVGRSISFAGVGDQIIFDDVTFGSVTPGDGGNSPVPEPSSMLLLATGVGAGLTQLRRRFNRSAI